MKVRTSQIDQLVEEGNWAAKLTSRALDRLDAYLSASQVGITVTSLALGWAIEGWVIPGVRSLLRARRGSGGEASTVAEHGMSLSVVPIVAFTLVTFLHVALGEQAPKSLAIRSAKTRRALDGAAVDGDLSRLLAGHLAAEQRQQRDALAPRPGADRPRRAGPHRRGAAAHRRRERRRRAPLAQRAGDDRERPEPRREDGPAGHGPAPGHRLPEPLPVARRQPPGRPAGRPHPLPALRGRPDDRRRHDPRQGPLPRGGLGQRPARPAQVGAQGPVPARDAAASTSCSSSSSATGSTSP